MRRSCRPNGTPPIDYDAVRSCLKKLCHYIQTFYPAAEIACPKFGAGLAGGDWNIIKSIIMEELVEPGINVTVYTFKESTWKPSL